MGSGFRKLLQFAGNSARLVLDLAVEDVDPLHFEAHWIIPR
jgi:hypothetical protein